MGEYGSSTRAGFWRRLFAFLVDFALIVAIIGPVGLWLGLATSGRVRISNTIVDLSICMGRTTPIELQLPSDFKVTNLVECTKYFLGIPHDWILNVTERTALGPNSVYTRGATLPLDPAGQLANPFYLDVLVPLLLLVYLFLAERRFGRSVGKRALKLSVRSIDGEPLRGVQVAKRTLFYMVPILSYQAVPLYLMTIDSKKWAMEAFGNATSFKLAWLAGLLLTLGFAINFIFTSWRRTLPWHDEWAGTEVVRLSSRLDQPSQDISETFA